MPAISSSSGISISTILAPAAESLDSAAWKAAETAASRSSRTRLRGTAMTARGNRHGVQSRRRLAGQDRIDQRAAGHRPAPAGRPESSVLDSGTRPSVGTRRLVGLKPTSPQKPGRHADRAGGIGCPSATAAMSSVTENRRAGGRTARHAAGRAVPRVARPCRSAGSDRRAPSGELGPCWWCPSPPRRPPANRASTGASLAAGGRPFSTVGAGERGMAP